MKIFYFVKKLFIKEQSVSTSVFWSLAISLFIIGVGFGIVMINLLLKTPSPKFTGENNENQSNVQNISQKQKPTTAIVVYSDLSCPYCAQQFFSIREYAQENGNIEFIYKHFPKTEIFPYSNLAAQAVECAGDQEQFWQSAEYFFSNQDKINNEFIFELSNNLPLDNNIFLDCLNTAKYEEKVNQEYNEGISLGVTNVPTSFIGDEKHVGAMTKDNLAQLTAAK